MKITQDDNVPMEERPGTVTVKMPENNAEICIKPPASRNEAPRWMGSHCGHPHSLVRGAEL